MHISNDVISGLLFFSGFIIGNCFQICCCQHQVEEDDVSTDSENILDSMALRRAIHRSMRDNNTVVHAEPSAPFAPEGDIIRAQARYMNEDEHVIDIE
jgi:hypothetical protein